MHLIRQASCGPPGRRGGRLKREGGEAEAWSQTQLGWGGCLWDKWEGLWGPARLPACSGPTREQEPEDGQGDLGGGAGPRGPRFWVAGSENLPYLPRVHFAPEEDRRCHGENGPFSPFLGSLGKIPAFQNFS